MGAREIDPAVEKVHLKKLQEIILDDDRIYTVRLAAFELNVTIQEAETLLEKLIKTTEKTEKLACTYILTGPLKSSGNKSVLLAKDDNLEEKRLLFENIESQVLCSVQKSKNIDLNQICTIDCPNKTGDTALPGLIISKNCGRRIINQRKLPSPVKSANLAGPSKTTIKSSEIKTETQTKTKTSPKGLANFLNNAPKTISPKKEKTVPNKTKGGLSGFLAKSTDSNIKKPEKVEKEKEIVKEEVVEEMDVDIVKIEESTQTSKPDEKPKTKSKPQKAKVSKKRSRSDPDTTPNKKRKRIIKVIDSDSDDMFENDENSLEDIIESDDETKPVSIASKPLENKNKKRKAVDKTYEDEEGFIITKTEYVYETASEDENEEPPKNEIKPKQTEITSKGQNVKKGGKKPLATGKQTTLLGFFNKK